MSNARRMLAPGPFRADQIREGDPYELSNGHAILCMPTGRRGGRSNLTGGGVLETDPAVKSAGVDVGFSQDPSHLRAPDVSVGDFPDEPGWATEAPPLAVEYADRGQDERELQAKIDELLGAGTRFVWVVRLTGPRRVEVHTHGKKTQIVHSGGELRAPGILQNPVPVDAMFDRDAAHEATLRNLLQRKGYASLDAVLAEGQEQGEVSGRAAALIAVLGARGLTLTSEQRRTIEETRDNARLDAWIVRAAVATSTDDVLGGEAAPGKGPSTRKGPARRKA